MTEIIDYDIEALKDGITKARANIQIFETAIENENNTIKEYRNMISVLEDKRDRQNRSNS